MLVLSRKVGEKLVIADNIVLEVVRVSKDRISIGITAPSEVKIRRSELAPLHVMSKEEMQVDLLRLTSCGTQGSPLS